MRRTFRKPAYTGGGRSQKLPIAYIYTRTLIDSKIRLVDIVIHIYFYTSTRILE